jgi:general secretion pathway protein L
MHRIVGLDWAAQTVRVAVLQGGFRGAELQDVREAPLPADGAPAERLKAGLAALRLEPALGPDDTFAVSLPGSSVSAHLISLPFSEPKRIEQVLPAEVEGVIPFDVADVVWDHAILGTTNGKTDVLVGVVQKHVLRDHLAQLAAAGVDPRVVTLAPLALAALGERGSLTAPEGWSAALLDASPDRADLAILDQGRAVAARSLANAPAWETQRVTALLARDLKISLRTRKTAPQKLLLAGAIADLPEAPERLSEDLQLPAERVMLPRGDASSALALGLALRAQTPRGKINFRKGEFAFTRDSSQLRGTIRQLAIAAAVLLGLAIFYGVARLHSLHQQADAYDEAVCAATKKILGTCTTDYRQAIGQLSGGKSRAAGIPRVSGADVFAEVVAHLPDNALPLLEDVEVTTTSIRLKGTADSYGKVDEVIAALKKDKCFGEIKQPRTEKTRDNKVTFSLDFAYTCSGESPGGA